LDSVSSLQNDQLGFEVLSAVVGALQGEDGLLHRALQVATEMRDELLRSRALSVVAAQLHGDDALLRQALEDAAKLHDEQWVAEAFCGVAAQLRRRSGCWVLEEALRQTVGIREEIWRTKTLSRIAPLLEGDAVLLRQAVTIATSMQSEHCRSGALGAVASQLQEGTALLQEILLSARKIRDAGLRVEALSAVAARLRGKSKDDMASEALKSARGVEEPRWRVDALCTVAPHLQEEPRREVLGQALEEAAEIADEMWQAQALSRVISQLRREDGLSIQALKAALAIEDRARCVIALSAVVPLLQEEAHPNALTLALKLTNSIEDDERWRSAALHALGPRLLGNGALLREALRQATEIQNENWRPRALCAVVAQAGEDPALKSEVLGLGKAVGDPEGRAEVLTAVAAGLKGREKRKALKAALTAAASIVDAEERATALCAMVGELRDYADLHAIYMKAALAFPNDQKKRIVVCGMLTGQQPEFVSYPLWLDWLTETYLTRRELLGAIDVLARSAIQLTGTTEVADGIAAAVRDVCEWWP
jgi:hypothetical protein